MDYITAALAATQQSRSTLNMMMTDLELEITGVLGSDEDTLVGGCTHTGGLTQLYGTALLPLGRVPHAEEPLHRGFTS